MNMVRVIVGSACGRGVVVAILCAVSPRLPAFADDMPLWESYTEAGTRAMKEKRYDEAEKMYLAARREAQKLGSEDLSVATTLKNLGMLYERQGRYALAEHLYKQVL